MTNLDRLDAPSKDRHGVLPCVACFEGRPHNAEVRPGWLTLALFAARNALTLRGDR